MKVENKIYKVKYGLTQQRSTPCFYLPLQYCGKPDECGEVNLIGGYHSCREGFMSLLLDQFNEDLQDRGIPNDRFRLHVFETVNNIWEEKGKTSRRFVGKKVEEFPELEKTYTRSILFGKKVLNMLEGEAKWLKTKVYRLVDPDFEDSHISYMFEASRRWMKAPYLLSMFCLIVRSANTLTFDVNGKRFKDASEIIKKVKTLKDYFALIEQSRDNLACYVYQSYPYWQLILKSYPEIWEKRKMEYYWDTDRLPSRWPSHEGLQKLITGDAADDEVRKKFKKILKEKGMKFVEEEH